MVATDTGGVVSGSVGASEVCLAEHAQSERRFRSFCALAARELFAGAGTALLFALLAYGVVMGWTASFDQAVFEWLRRPAAPWLDAVAHGLSLLGSEALGVIHLLLLAVLLKQRRFALAAGLFVATAGAGLLNGWIKDFFDRARPAEVYGLLPASGGQLFSFPSGHAMVSAAFLFFLAYIAWPAIPRGRRTIAASGLVVLLVVVGLARTYLGAHYLTDVVAGYLIGFVWADLVILGGFLVGCRWQELLVGADRSRAASREPGPVSERSE